MRSTIIRIALVLAVVAMAGGFWCSQQQRTPSRVNGSAYESEMIEGLVRGLLQELGPQAPPVCFLAFGEGATTPSPGFVARFAGTRPAIKSVGSAVSPPIGKFFDKSSGRPGLIIHIVSFKEYIPGTFDVLVAFSNLPSGHDRFIYRLSSLTGEWKIKSRQPE